MGAKFLSETNTEELVQQIAWPVEHRPDSFPTYPGDPMGDDPNEFGSVCDYNGKVIVCAQNGTCRLIAIALNRLAAQYGIDVRERPQPRLGRRKKD